MRKTLIIGIGNPFRGDDGLGWHAVNQLEKTISSPNVEIIAVQQLTMDLVENVGLAELVIFIDCQLSQIAGTFTTKTIESNSSIQSPVSHFFDPGTLLAAVQALYGKHPKGILFSISSEKFDYSEELSPEVNSALPELITAIQNSILK